MRLPLAIAALATVIAAALPLGLLAPLDVALRDFRFAHDHRAPSGEVVFVEIDSRSLEAVGVWPWPRTVHAEVLYRLLDLGAADIAFDIDFSTPSPGEGDAALEAALAEAGGYAILAGFRQLGDGAAAGPLTLPLPRFAAHAAVAAVNVAADNTGIVRRMPYAITAGETVLPALPVLLAGVPRETGTGEYLIDYSIDAALVDRISVADILAGTVDPERVRDRQIVIGASALELRDVMMTPTQGPLPGALIQILATETILKGRDLRLPGPLPGLVLVAAVALLLLVLRRRLLHWSGIAAMAAGAVVIELGAFLLQSAGILLLDTAPAHLLSLSGIIAAVAIEAVERRRLHLEAARQRTEALERLAHAATYDDTTGALTRRAFLDRVEASLRRRDAVAIVSLRLERFERLAATLGSRHTDPALQEVVRRLRLLAPIAVGRIDSATFVLLFPAADAHAASGRLPALLDEAFATGDHRVVLSAYIGLARAAGADGETTAEALLNHAELARSTAEAARHRAPMHFRPAMEHSFAEARELEVALREAIDEKSIELYLQGQFHLASGAVCGAEALARWRHPRFGTVSPARFVPIAEQAGLAIKLGSHMLEAACHSATQWPAHLRVSVNVSPAQFEFDDVPRLIARTLEATGLDPARLDIEITEGLVLRAHPSTIDTLKAIREMGVGIALDDFGTGYSSLSYLGTLPIDTLKIDQSFIRRLLEEERVETIVEAVLGLCASLEITAVAEGIETEAQAEWLRRRHCDIGQGFLFHRPSPAADFKWFARQLSGDEDAPLPLTGAA